MELSLFTFWLVRVFLGPVLALLACVCGDVLDFRSQSDALERIKHASKTVPFLNVCVLSTYFLESMDPRYLEPPNAEIVLPKGLLLVVLLMISLRKTLRILTRVVWHSSTPEKGGIHSHRECTSASVTSLSESQTQHPEDITAQPISYPADSCYPFTDSEDWT